MGKMCRCRAGETGLAAPDEDSGRIDWKLAAMTVSACASVVVAIAITRLVRHTLAAQEGGDAAGARRP